MVKSILATAPEQMLESHVLPPSPTKRARVAIMDKAKRDAAPLKVQMEVSLNLKTFSFVNSLLDPLQPVKKRPILDDFDLDKQRVKPGEPLKKRVTPWLLEAPWGGSQPLPR